MPLEPKEITADTEEDTSEFRDMSRRILGGFSDDLLGKHPKYVTALQFQPAQSAEFSDKPVIPGAPVRMAGAQGAGKDSAQAEVLGFLTAINQNEIVAAMAASKKQLSSRIAEYAKMLH